jgi:hypothetical protein
MIKNDVHVSSYSDAGDEQPLEVPRGITGNILLQVLLIHYPCSMVWEEIMTFVLL